MNSWFEIVSTIMQSQAAEVVTCKSADGICPASAFNAVAAAFATQGYFVQADILFFLVGTGFGAWAPLIYLIAAAGGIVSLAMGMPPKMYIWFFVGPGIYHWLVETRSPAHGVQWQVGGVDQDQRAVWRLAHVGLLNSSIVARMNGEISGIGQDTRYELGSAVKQTSWCKPSPDPVYVSNFFVWFDQLVSYTVQRLVNITGITRTIASSGTSGANQGVLDLPDTGGGTGGTGAANTNNWYLMSDKKWMLLDTITAARLSNSDIRDAFVTFLSSECGDALSLSIDHTNFVVASNSTYGLTPCSVMLHTNTAEIRQAQQVCTDANAEFLTDGYRLVWEVLRDKSVPIPEGIRRIFQDDSLGSFAYFLNGLGSEAGKKMAGFYRSQDVTECHQTFYTLMQAFRWEAAQVYDQLIKSGPGGIDPKNLLFNLFYGWGVRKTVAGELVPQEEMEDWTRNLILVHLLRNELAMAPRVADKKFTNQLTLDNFSQNYVAQTGSKTKYGEVYSWARMVPYIQGILLYLLAMGYPFACIMIVMPGWHKTLFTWMSFWVWVKLWDAGFAVVSVVERSVWSMLGNSTKLNYTSPLIYQMTNWGKTDFKEGESCGQLGGALATECFADLKLTNICAAVPDFTANGSQGAEWWHAAALFDRALMLGSTMDIDVANGYYIYLMSALYFAVPAATGQLVLGAKAGVAGMANSLMQGAQQDGGKGASSGFTGDLKNKASQSSAAMGQSVAAKAYRSNGMAGRALDASNQGLDYAMQGQQIQAANQNLGLQSANKGLSAAVRTADINTAGALANYAAAWAQNPMGHIADSVNKGKSPDTSFSDPQGMFKNVYGPMMEKIKGGQERGGSNPAETTGGILGKAVSKVPGVVGAGASSYYQLQASGVGLGTAAANGDVTRDSNAFQADANSQQAYNNVGAFAANSMGSALQTTQSRMTGAADFAAQSAGYHARRDLADSAGGYTASLGVDTMHLAVGNKPADMMGLASQGMLGSSMRSSFAYSSSGFMTARGNAIGQLSGGASSVQSQYTGGSSSIWGGVNASQTSLDDINSRAGVTYGRYNVSGLGSAFNKKDAD